MFTRINSFSIKPDGHIERRQAEVPMVIKPAPVVVRIVDGTDKREALQLIRRLVDELEAMP
jgi:hypothetical protein